ncbi:MAG: hypothetical protein ABFR95_03380 [Actinomycetota bacterium]
MTDIARIVRSARAAGIEIDEAEAARWLTAVASTGDDHSVTFDERQGVFGHRIAMLDFDHNQLEHFRWVGRLVEIPDSDGIETALALSGSAAQSKIQTFPGDCDFFERVNIHADSFEEACLRFGTVIRNKALASLGGDAFRLMEVKFGEYPNDVTRDGSTHHKGSSISWSAEDVIAGEIRTGSADGSRTVLSWNDAAMNPGWCKLDWVVADGSRGELVNASNMIDATWEAPDGSLSPLDGYLDPYFQEIYLETESVPLFTKVVANVDGDALEGYVESLEKEVRKYLAGDHPNIGKAAKRMYNVFRLNGQYAEAAFVRELFDEPANVLYQIYAVVRTIEEASQPDSDIDPEIVEAQLDAVILDTVGALEDVEEREIVALLLDLKSDLADQQPDPVAVEGARAALLNVVNNFFRDKLNAMPEVRAYMALHAS